MYIHKGLLFNTWKMSLWQLPDSMSTENVTKLSSFLPNKNVFVMQDQATVKFPSDPSGLISFFAPFSWKSDLSIVAKVLFLSYCSQKIWLASEKSAHVTPG